jgi:hypothetical protein
MSNEYFGKVIKTDDKGINFVINRGSEHGVEMETKFLIMEIGDDIIDPDTGEYLGKLEIVKGKVSPSHIQEKMTTVTSIEYIDEPDRKEIKYSPPSINNKNDFYWGLVHPYKSKGRENPIETIIAGERRIKNLQGVKVGDVVKIISRF